MGSEHFHIIFGPTEILDFLTELIVPDDSLSNVEILCHTFTNAHLKHAQQKSYPTNETQISRVKITLISNKKDSTSAPQKSRTEEPHG